MPISVPDGPPDDRFVYEVIGWLPDVVAAPMMKTVGLDRLGALYTAIDVVRRGGTISTSGVYGGAAEPMRCDADPLGVDGFATHHLPLESAPEAYALFQRKQDGMVKTLLKPGA